MVGVCRLFRSAGVHTSGMPFLQGRPAARYPAHRTPWLRIGIATPFDASTLTTRKEWPDNPDHGERCVRRWRSAPWSAEMGFVAAANALKKLSPEELSSISHKASFAAGGARADAS